MSYPLKTLQELCRIIIGRTPSRSEPSYWGKGNKWVSISDLDGKIVVDTKEEITDLAVESARCRRISKGTLLFSFKLTIGKMAFAGEDLFTNEAIAALEIKDPDALSASYLYYALQSAKVGGSNQAAKGKTLNSKSLAEIEIPLPSLDDQIRIAALLGKVEGLIAQRKRQLQQLDDLLKSVFLDLFGNPVRNEKGWETVPLSSLGSLNRGVSKHRPRNAPELLGGQYPLIQTGEVTNSGTYMTSFSQTYSDIGFAQSKLWPAGTLCITIAANIAHTSILTFDACFPDSVVGFTAYERESHGLYVHGLFWFFRSILERNAPAAAQKNINLEILRGTHVPKPPIDLQRQFAAAVGKIEAVKTAYQQSLTYLESLYGCLSQRAFKGELDLSRVPLSEMERVEPQTAVPAANRSLANDPNALHLPDSDLVMAALNDDARLKELVDFWLDAYRTQLNGAAFSAQAFLATVQTRVAELHPDAEFEIGVAAYEQVKSWVFASLARGQLAQGYVDTDNRVALGAATAVQG